MLKIFVEFHVRLKYPLQEVYYDKRFSQLYQTADKIIDDEANKILCKHGGLIYSCELFVAWNRYIICCLTVIEEHDFWRAVLHHFIFFKLLYFATLNKTTIDTSNLFCLPMIKTRKP